MYLQMLRSKLHGAVVTGSELEYEGSLTIDRSLMEAVKMNPHEKILVANMANGERFETYAIPGDAGSGSI
ncbi:MAG: aspartate 1-decarboxylase, partial [Lentisphaerae bacterium]|nr:aspartate 1-decarboxylase [Lentisphaerota bacterium]